ncbi:Lethal(2) giant larvae sro7, partial [Coemansia sp. IMI 209127]
DRAIDTSDDATAVIFEPIQGVMAVGYASGAIRLFSDKLPTNVELSTRRRSAIRHLVALPGQPVLAAIDDLSTLWVFDTDLLRLCFSYNVPIAPTCVGLIAGTNWLLIGTDAGRLYFVDVLEGRKSDFSIGCQVKPLSPVVSVSAHPVETERLLIAYAEGTCVVCDLGKASGSENAMILSRHRPEHRRIQMHDEQSHRDSAHDYYTMGPELTSASWSPGGSLIAAAYDNGTVCVFGTNSSSSSPIAMRSVLYPNDERSSVDTLDQSTHYVGNVRWCTLASTDQTFILVTSGLSRSSQRYVTIFGSGTTSTLLKGSNDIAPRGFFELAGAVDSLCLLPQKSPLGDGIHGVVLVSRQKQHSVQALEIGPDMQLREMASLPAEVVWCNYHPTTIRQTRDKTGLSICALLQGCLTSKTTVPAGQPKTHMDDGMPIEQLMCTGDTTETLRLWCNISTRMELAECDGLVLDIEYVSRMLGIENQNIVAIDVNAKNGLIAVGLDTGEILLCALTDNPQLSLAQRCTPLDQIRELAHEFYADQRETFSQKPDHAKEGENQPTPADTSHLDVPWPEPMPPLEPSSSRGSESSTGVFSKVRMRSRAASTHDGHLLRRSSKRLSASIGSFLKRGSVLVDNTKRQSEISTTKMARSSNLCSISSYSTACHAVLPRPVEINYDAWESSQANINLALSQMLYGLCFSADDVYRMRLSGRNGPLDSTGVKTTVCPQQESVSDHARLNPLILPFMLARFYSSKAVDIVSGPNGIIATAFEDGAVVVIDCVKQEVVLSDNINQTPTAKTEAADIFRPPVSLTGVNSQVSFKPARITSMSVCEIKCTSSEVEQGPESNRLVECLAVGTSLGYVLVYSICRVDPPAMMAVRSGDDDSILLVYADVSAASISSDPGQDQDTILVVCSQSSMSTHLATNSEPMATYTLHSSTIRFIAANVVTLASGWHGIVGIDSQWNIILRTLPELGEESVLNFASASDSSPSLLDDTAAAGLSVQISSAGRILVAGHRGGFLMQASITDTKHLASTGATSATDTKKTTYFDIALQPPPLPARKGITSWLFGKSANASTDITAFLGRHSRDLIVNGAVKPGERFMKTEEPLQPEEALSEAGPSNRSKRTDSKIEGITNDIELGPFSDMKMMAERRGQQLEDLGDRTQRMVGESQRFLDNIRAYNAAQEKKKNKRFTLFHDSDKIGR